jgi:vitamin B12/bleomycin/antimicrobial peptide transport system ATP-binding/permease protein
MISLNRHTWSRFVAISTPFFRSEVRWQALAWLALLLALLVAINGLNILNSYVSRDFMTAVATRAAGRFAALALRYAGVFAVTTLVTVCYRFTEERLGLFWRQWLTQHVLHRYLSQHAYYWISARADIDNPDQRIAEDIRTFTATTLSFLLILLNSSITLVAFSGILWSITPWLVFAAVVYALFGSLMTLGLGYRLVGLNFLQLKKEADLRYDLIRLREYAEAIAFLRGEAQETARLRGRLAAAVANGKHIIAITRNLGFFTTGYNYMTQIIPVLIVAPLYIREDIEFGIVTQAAMAFTFVLGACSLLVTEFQRLSAFAAVVTRLGTLGEAIAATSVPAGPMIEVIEDNDRVAYDHLTLHTPQDGRVLIQDLCVDIPLGQRLMIQEPRRTGKSMLVRATAGLWTTGQGRLVRPRLSNVMFLPQQPFNTHGSLRSQLVYACPRKGITDDTMLRVLHAVQFEPVLQRVGGLDAEGDWAEVLSASEQQVLAFAQLLLARPRFAFLDEAVNVIDPDHRQQLYEVLSETSITYISISNDPMLLQFHDRVLELGPDGAWSVQATRPQQEFAWSKTTPPPGQGEEAKGYCRLCLGPVMVQGIPEDASRQRPGLVPIFEQHLAVDDGVVDASGEFPDAPLAGWKTCTTSSGSVPTGSGSKRVMSAARPGRSRPRS